MEIQAMRSNGNTAQQHLKILQYIQLNDVDLFFLACMHQILQHEECIK